MEQAALDKVLLGPKGQPLKTPMASVQHPSFLIFIFSSSKKMIVIVNYIKALCRNKIYRVDMNI